LCSSLYLLPNATFIILKVSVAFYPCLKQHLVHTHCAFKSLTLRYAKFTSGTTHACTKQDITQLPQRLQPYSKEEKTQPTIINLHPAVRVCANISSVISQAVQKLLDHITYMLHHINSGLNFTDLPKDERYIKPSTFALFHLYKLPK
jgi:hypothetical protein